MFVFIEPKSVSSANQLALTKPIERFRVQFTWDKLGMYDAYAPKVLCNKLV